VFMPYVIAFNKKAVKEKIERLAAYIGLKPRYSAFLDWTLALREELGVPHTLAGLKVDDQKFDLMSKMAPKDPTAGGNPVTLTKAGALKLYRKTLEGTV
jgi:alcohol dehydrogenase class IV